jgi:hypothetical protein
MGYSGDDMTGHGFRSMASTLLNEQGWNRDAIERQLAHGERDAVRAAYNYAQHLPERREMMQAWANFLDQLKAGTQADEPKRRRSNSGKTNDVQESTPAYSALTMLTIKNSSGPVDLDVTPAERIRSIRSSYRS